MIHIPLNPKILKTKKALVTVTLNFSVPRLVKKKKSYPQAYSRFLKHLHPSVTTVSVTKNILNNKNNNLQTPKSYTKLSCYTWHCNKTPKNLGKQITPVDNLWITLWITF